MVNYRSVLLIVLLILAGVTAACGVTPGEPVVMQGPEVFVFPMATEEVLISSEDILQNNCDGSAEASDTIERSHTVLRTLELGTGITVDAGGRAGIPGIGEVGIGAAVASHYQVSYGTEETVTRSVTVAAKEGTSIQHTVRQFEVWETGEILVSAGGANQQIPYRFRKDFSMERLPPANLGCPGPGAQPLPPTSEPDTGGEESGGQTQAVTEAPAAVSGITSGQLDGLFGSSNWFCFPDRTNGVGVKSLPVNFTVAAPLRYVDTFRGRYQVGDTEPGATGATVELTSALPPGQCPGWQQEALASWAAARSTGRQISSAGQLDSILGQGNWACLPDYPFGARVFFFNSDLRIEFPFTTVDVSDGSKHGVGETVNPNGEMTVWFAGAVPREECP